MSVLVFLLSLVIVSSSLHAQDATAVPATLTREDFHLQGQVDSMYSITYRISLHDRVMPDSTVFTDTLISKSAEVNMQFDSSGRLQSRRVDSFDASGRLTVNVGQRYYYEGDRLMAVVHFDDGKMKDSIQLSYNRKGYPDEQALYGRKKKLQGYVQYFYRNDKVFNVKERDDTRALVKFIRMEYDAWGRLTEKQVMDNSMHLFATRAISYDTTEAGDIRVNEVKYAADGQLSGMEGRVINKLGYVTEVTMINADKSMERQSTYTYNPKGLPASELTFTTVKQAYAHLYEYDEQGNWKMRRTYTDELPVSKTYRVIEYTNSQLSN